MPDRLPEVIRTVLIAGAAYVAGAALASSSVAPPPPSTESWPIAAHANRTSVRSQKFVDVPSTGGCRQTDALRVIGALRAGGWEWDGYRMIGRGISIWYANGPQSLGFDIGNDSSPGYPIYEPDCRSLIWEEIVKEQRRGIADVLTAGK